MPKESAQWPCLQFETLPWHHDPDSLAGISKTARRRIASTYQAAIPLDIANRPLTIGNGLSRRLADLSNAMVRFDEKQRQRGFDLPALLLRSESAASSQIENLTSSARNIAMAEITANAPHNAQLIVGNIQAMREALSSNGDLTVPEILRIHATLMNRGGFTSGGTIRREQVWVGGYPYSPHGALFVPPSERRVAACLDDLLAFLRRSDIDGIAKAAIMHAQFETIHPFTDGNGRTGRTLLHIVLRNNDLLRTSTLPVSAGLLHNIDAYMEAITAYQQGEPLAVVEQVASALELAIAIGDAVAERIDALCATWKSVIQERTNSKIHALPSVLVAQPVVNSKYIADALGITQRAAKTLINRACEYGMIRPIGNKQRGELYQADDVIDLLDEISSIEGIRRLFAMQ